MSKMRFYISLVAVVVVLFIALMNNQNVTSQVEPKYHVYECLELASAEAMLKHLKAHNGWVDQFVILEEKEKAEGQTIHWEYPALKDQLAEFDHKITYIASYSLPTHIHETVRKFHVKNQFLKGLDECNDRDIILFGNARSQVALEEVAQAIKHLSKKPEEVVSFQTAEEITQLAYITTYRTVKKELPASIKSKTQLKSHAIDWKAFFFPLRELMNDS